MARSVNPFALWLARQVSRLGAFAMRRLTVGRTYHGYKVLPFGGRVITLSGKITDAGFVDQGLSHWFYVLVQPIEGPPVKIDYATLTWDRAVGVYTSRHS